MAKKAALGVIEFGDTPTAVGEVRSWEQTSEANEIDTTVMGTGNARFQPGSIRHTINAELFFEYADAGQALIIAQLGNDTPQDVALYPQGKGSTLPVASGKAFIMNTNTAGQADGAIEMTVSMPSDENGYAWTAQA